MIEIPVTKRINPSLFKEEMAAAGLLGVLHRVVTIGGQQVLQVDVDQGQAATVSAVYTAHDHTQQSALQVQQAMAISIRNEALSVLDDIPDYFTWTPAEGETYIDTNVTDLASAKGVIKGLWRMNCALRDVLLASIVALKRTE